MLKLKTYAHFISLNTFNKCFKKYCLRPFFPYVVLNYQYWQIQLHKFSCIYIYLYTEMKTLFTTIHNSNNCTTVIFSWSITCTEIHIYSSKNIEYEYLQIRITRNPANVSKWPMMQTVDGFEYKRCLPIGNRCTGSKLYRTTLNLVSFRFSLWLLTINSYQVYYRTITIPYKWYYESLSIDNIPASCSIKYTYFVIRSTSDCRNPFFNRIHSMECYFIVCVFLDLNVILFISKLLF